MRDECLICKAPLEYLAMDVPMECAVCGKRENSKTRCINGHYVCGECHTKGLDSVIGACLSETSKDPVEIITKMMDQPFCHMHGPEHHIMVGAALIAAYRNAGGEVDLEAALKEMEARGGKYPGGSCGFWGCCGAAVSVGMFWSIVTGTTPLSGKTWGLANQATAAALQEIGSLGGPRCCKRNSFTAIRAGAAFVKEHLGVEMELPEEIVCHYYGNNRQCIREKCPYYRKPE